MDPVYNRMTRVIILEIFFRHVVAPDPIALFVVPVLTLLMFTYIIICYSRLAF